MAQGAFHSLHTVRRGRETDANTRLFTGDGTPFLRLPGLMLVGDAQNPDLPSVRVGDTPIPFFEKRTYPRDPDGNFHDEVTHPMLSIQVDHDGTPVLCRSQWSNDGIWQKDIAIAVTGQWEDEASLSPARCTAIAQRSGKQCERDAEADSTFCRQHQP